MSSAARDIRGTRAPPGVRAVAFAQVMTSALSAAVTVCKTVGSALALKQIEPAAGGPGLADGWAPTPAARPRGWLLRAHPPRAGHRVAAQRS